VSKKFAIAIASVAILVLLVWCSSSDNLSRVHPSVGSLREPFKRVNVDYYLDGGSVGIDITDRDGVRIQLAIPIDDGPGDTRTYHRLYVGTLYYKQTNATELPFTKDTKRFLVNVIRRYGTGPDRDCSLIALGSPGDRIGVYGRLLLRKATGTEKDYTLW
jgi:hypothetical protein